MLDTVTKLVINNRINHDKTVALEHNKFLNRFMDDKCSNDDWCHYCDLGSKNSISVEYWEQFSSNNVVHIYLTNKDVSYHNIKCLEKLGKPIIHINAEHTDKHHNATANQSNVLDSHLFLRQ